MKLGGNIMEMVREMAQMDDTIDADGLKFSVFHTEDFDEDHPEYEVFGVEPSSGLRRVQFTISDGHTIPESCGAVEQLEAMRTVWGNRE
jgi:hypothetical protein